MKTLRVIRSMYLPGLNPISTNRLKTVRNGKIKSNPLYEDWQVLVVTRLPDGFFDGIDLTKCMLRFTMGITKRFDIDNTLKGFIDVLEEKYGFNDRDIHSLIAKKVVIDPKIEKPFVRLDIIEAFEDDMSQIDSFDTEDFISEDINALRDSIMKK